MAVMVALVAQVRALLAHKSDVVKVAKDMVVLVVPLSAQAKIALVDQDSMKDNSVQSVVQDLVVLAKLVHLLMVQELALT